MEVEQQQEGGEEADPIEDHQQQQPQEEEQAVYISDLPEELIEYIFFHLSPYRDLQSAKLVSRQWYRLVQGVIRQLDQNFHDSIACSQVLWTKLLPGDSPSITERYSHCACYYDKSLYIFGGCTSTNTTFNDLWRFNLATRQWIRPLATGTYPSPKACASMVVYKDSLVLFGGWSHPTPSPLHQAARFFNELHIYTPDTNRWSYVTSRSMPQLVAGHSACVIKDSMIIFGGSNFPGIGSNDIWIFDFIERYWYKKETYGPKPSPRYGQSQIAVDDNNILIIGGCGGPNQIFNDVWMLVLGPNSMHWEQIQVLQPEFSAPQLWCHPACKVHDTVVVLSKPAKSMKLVPPSLPKWSQLRGQRSWQMPQSNNTSLSSSTSSRADRAGAAGSDQHDSSSSRREEDEKSDMEEAAQASWPVHGDYNAHMPQRNLARRNTIERDRNLIDMTYLSQERRSAELSHSSSINGASSSIDAGSSGSSMSRAMDELPSSSASSPNSALPSNAAFSDNAASASSNGLTVHVADSANGSSSGGASLNRSSPNGLSTDGSVLSAGRHDGIAMNEGSPNGSYLNGGLSRAALSPNNGLPPTPGSGPSVGGGHSPLNNVPSSRFYHLSMRPNRQKQLEMLQRYEDKIKRQQQHHRQQPPSGFLRTNHKVSQGSNHGQNSRDCCNSSSGGASSSPKEPRSLMHLHNLDISRVVTDKTVTWQRVRENISDCIPEEAIFYSLVEGRGELIMFGGIQRDINSMQRGVRIKSHVVSNNLYVLSSPRPNF